MGRATVRRPPVRPCRFTIRTRGISTIEATCRALGQPPYPKGGGGGMPGGSKTKAAQGGARIMDVRVL